MSGLIVALDFPTVDDAVTVAKPLVEVVDGFKVGLELLSAEGPGAIETVAALGRPVFADMKLHDIPNTVERAASRIAAAGARWVTTHASGGAEMLEAANRGMGGTGVLAVTVLTSFSEEDLVAIGVTTGIAGQVEGLARLAQGSGVEGLVCAPGEVAGIRASGIDLTVFTPGIRMELGDRHDQKRVATPLEAIAAGADYLVVGRPITQAPDPVAVAREIGISLTPTR